MEEILEKLKADFDESEGSIRIVGANWSCEDLRLSLSIQFYDEPELWDIYCTGVLEDSLNSEFADFVSVSSDSAMLKPYVEPQVDLMFSGNDLTPAFFLGVVCSSCIEIIASANHLPRFINQQPTTTGIVRSKYGRLGRFPESVAARILEALNGQPIKINAIPALMPKRWNRSEFESYRALKVLQIGKSYVVGEQFSSRRA